MAEVTDWVGRPLDRVDGQLKVTGTARYAADFTGAGCVHAVAFTSAVAKGRVLEMDLSQARSHPGVIAVLRAGELPPLPNNPGDEIYYHLQYLGLVIAQTPAAAQRAAQLVKIKYDLAKPVIDARQAPSAAPPPAGRGARGAPYQRGDPDAALAHAEFKFQQTYTTAMYHHHPMEMLATVAVWDDDHVTLYDTTQGVIGARAAAARGLNIDPTHVHVLSPFLGGGFGCKGSPWPHTVWAAAAAKHVGLPVKFIVTRHQMFANTGHRPVTIQTLTVGADQSGKLISLAHDTTSTTGEQGFWIEAASNQSRYFYECPNVRATQKVVRINEGQPCQMRAPGIGVGMYGMEAAMDELAYAANVDPLQLRLLNYAETDPAENKPYSSKALRQCYEQGAEKFGWAKRPMKPRSMRDGTDLIGWGMASANYHTGLQRATATARVFPDGRAIVMTAGQDLGTGMYTIATQIAADALGIPPDKVLIELGDSDLPPAPGAGGSTQAVSVGSAVKAAAEAVLAAMWKKAGQGHESEPAIIRGDRLCLRGDPSVGIPLGDFWATSNSGEPIEATASGAPPADSNDYAKYAWGATFAEVRVDEQLGTIRVSRVVGAFAGGRILNPKTARSQIIGGIVMGIGMALTEQTILDPVGGQIVTGDLASYLLPVNADAPEIDCIFVEEHDPHVNSLGAKGIGEISITGTAPAIASAVFHATGKRVRDLPITLDDLL